MYFQNDWPSEDRNDLQAFSPEGHPGPPGDPQRREEALDEFPSESALEVAGPDAADLELFAEPTPPVELLTPSPAHSPLPPQAAPAAWAWRPMGARRAGTALLAVSSIAAVGVIAVWLLSRSPEAPAPQQAASAQPPARADKPSATPTSSEVKRPPTAPSAGVAPRIPPAAIRPDAPRTRSGATPPLRTPKVRASYPGRGSLSVDPSEPIKPPDRIAAGSGNEVRPAPADRGNRAIAPEPDTPPIADAPQPAVTVETRAEEPPSNEPAPRPTTAAPPPAPTTTPLAREEDGVRSALARYQSAYERLDAGAAKDVWPSVNEAALARAFENLESQDLALSDCRLAVTGNRAQAWCKGTARYVRRVGSKAAQQDQRLWIFTLSKDASSWKIDSVQTR